MIEESYGGYKDIDGREMKQADTKPKSIRQNNESIIKFNPISMDVF